MPNGFGVLAFSDSEDDSQSEPASPIPKQADPAGDGKLPKSPTEAEQQIMEMGFVAAQARDALVNFNLPFMFAFHYKFLELLAGRIIIII